MPTNESRTTVFVSGGLGNQLFQIASGLQFESKVLVINISQLRGKFELYQLLEFFAAERRIQIIVDSTNISNVFTKAHNYLLRSTRWSMSWKVQEFIANLVGQIAIYISGLPAGGVYTEFSDFGKFIARNMNKQNFYVIGYFQNEQIARVIKENLIKYLDNAFNDNNKTDSVESGLELTLHIRRGDYALESKIGMLSLEYFERLLSEIFQNQYVERVNFFTNGNFDLSRIIDIEKVGSVIEKDSSTAVELLAKMRHGEIFVLSNSTLSWWAGYLCRNPRKVIYVPHPWFRTLSEPVNLIPVGWNNCPAIWSQENGA